MVNQRKISIQIVAKLDFAYLNYYVYKKRKSEILTDQPGFYDFMIIKMKFSQWFPKLSFFLILNQQEQFFMIIIIF